MIRSNLSGVGVIAAVVFSFGWAADKKDLDPQIAASTAKGQWITSGGDSGFQGYSPLDPINANNVKSLPPAKATSAR